MDRQVIHQTHFLLYLKKPQTLQQLLKRGHLGNVPLIYFLGTCIPTALSRSGNGSWNKGNPISFVHDRIGFLILYSYVLRFIVF